MDPMTIAMMAMSVANNVDQAQRAKNQQAAEAAKMRFSPWTKMEGTAVAQPNSWIMEGMGGYLKGLEYEQALQDKKNQADYLTERGDYLKNKSAQEKDEAAAKVALMKAQEEEIRAKSAKKR